MKKRILSMLLATLMVVSCFGTFTFASAAEYTEFTVAVEAGKIEADGTIHVDVMMYNNPGINAVDIVIPFDNTKVQFVSFDFNEDEEMESCLTGNGTLESNVNEKDESEYASLNKVTLVFFRANNYKVKSNPEKIMGMTFKVVSEFESVDFELQYDEDSGFLSKPSRTDPDAVLTPVIVNASVGLPEIEGVTLEGAEYTYDGTAKALEVKGATNDMVVIYSPENATNVGTHAVTATVSMPGHKTLTLNADLKITPATLTVSGVEAVNRDYDATNVVEINSANAALVGVKGDDDVTVTFPATATIANANAGNGLAVTYTAPTLGGADAGNYTLTAPSLTVDIDKLIVTVTPDAGQSKKVGSADPALTYTTDFDLATIGARLTGALAREAGEDSGEISKTYKILMGNLACSDANVVLALADEVFTILNKDVQKVDVNAPVSNFVYDTTAPTFNLGVNVTEGVATPNITYTSSDENVVTVDTNGVVTVVGAGTANVTVNVAGDANWAPFTKTVQFKVDPKEVVVTPVAGTAVYGENVNIDVTYASNSEFTVTGDAALASLNAGAQDILVGTLAIANKNYKLVFTTGVKFTITPKTVSVEGISFWPTINGETPEFKDFAPSVPASEIVAGDVVNVVVANPAVVENNGVYSVTGISSGNANYVLNTVVTDLISWVANVEEKAEDIAEEFNEKKVEVVVGQEILDVETIAEALPQNVTVVIVESSDKAVINVNGVINNAETETTVNVTFEVYYNGQPTGQTFVVAVKVPKQVITTSSDSRLQALLYYMYTKNQSTEQVKSVKASVAAGTTVEAGTKVELSTETAGATIYYTTNGQAPSVLSKVYTGPIEITENVTIRAIAVKSGMKTSATVTFEYAVDATSIALKDNADEIKYMEGRGDKFEADANATRYEVIAALANVFNVTTSNNALALTDVADEYKAVVDLFTAAGIINGYTDNTFRGDKEIKRAEVAKIICVMMGLDVDGAADAGFNDVDHWAKNYINACANAGYVQGKGEGRFAPDEYITRAQLAKLINNITGAADGAECAYDDVNKDAWYFGAVAAAAK